MRFLRKLLVRTVLLIVLAVLALAGVVYSAIDQNPLVTGGTELPSSLMDHAQTLVKALDQRGAPDDRIRTLQLSNGDVDLLAKQAARHFGVATEIDLQDREALVRASVPVPTVGGYFNLNAVVGETSAGLPRIDSLAVGQIHVPRWLARRAAAYAVARLSSTELASVPVETIRSVSIGQGLVRVEYEWQPGLEQRIAALAMPKADAERLREYDECIARALDDLPARRSSLVELAAPVMKLASQRSTSGDPVAENRAAFLSLALYVVGTGPAALVPEAREWTRAQPHALDLAGRDDLTKQFAMSAALAATEGTPFAEVVNKYRDAAGALGQRSMPPSSLAADRAGALLGRMAMKSPETARLIQARFAQGITEADLLPDLKDLPDNISEEDIKRRFGSAGGSPQAALQKEIERRLGSSRLLK